MDYDTKLGEWFKQVEKKKEELRARKLAAQNAASEQPPLLASEPEVESTSPPTARVVSQSVEEPQPVKMQGGVATAEAPSGHPEPQAKPAEPEAAVPEIFEEPESPQVEDFLSFLSRTEKADEPIAQPQALAEDINQGHLGLYEGTGEPRPIITQQEPEAPQTVAPEPQLVRPEAVQPQAAPPTAVPPVTEVAQAEEGEVSWARLPSQLYSLIESAQEEVAQHSYKAFKESRAGLIQRLLDPPISLEEAARILNVCPTTVRRYTNRGVLKHFRTAGNQRRFRLSDVLSFMEAQMGQAGHDS